MPHPNSNHGFDFQAWAAHGVPFLSRAEEEAIKDKLKARWEEEAATAAEKKQAAVEAAAAAPAAAAPAGDEGPSVEPPVHTSRDGTTIESLEEPEKGMVKDALTKVTTWFVFPGTLPPPPCPFRTVWVPPVECINSWGQVMKS